MTSYGLVWASEVKAPVQFCATAAPQSVSLKLAGVHTQFPLRLFGEGRQDCVDASFRTSAVPFPAPSCVANLKLPRLCEVPSQKSPNNSQIFTKKRVAPFLFYKFYKFRSDSSFIFNGLRDYKWEIGTEKWEIGTERWEIGTESRIYKVEKST
jgi:hypothetical protein